LLLVGLLKVVFVELLGAALEVEPLEVKPPEVARLGAVLAPELELLGVVLETALLGAVLVPVEPPGALLEPLKPEPLGVVRVPKPEVSRPELPKLESLGAVRVPRPELPKLEPLLEPELP
jgi:hypothetical protein